MNRAAVAAASSQPDVLAAFRFAGVAFPKRLGVSLGNRLMNIEHNTTFSH
ncbi:hypothetical protein [Caballeronia udeis]